MNELTDTKKDHNTFAFNLALDCQKEIRTMDLQYKMGRDGQKPQENIKVPSRYKEIPPQRTPSSGIRCELADL